MSPLDFRRVIEEADFEPLNEGPPGSGADLSSIELASLHSLDGRGVVESAARLNVGSVTNCRAHCGHARPVVPFPRVPLNQILHSATIRVGEGVLLAPLIAHEVGKEPARAVWDPVDPIVRAHHTAGVRLSERLLILRKVRIEQVEGRDARVRVLALELHGVGGEVLEVRVHLVDPALVPLLHALDVLRRVCPEVKGVLAWQLVVAPRARIPGDVDVRAEAGQARREIGPFVDDASRIRERAHLRADHVPLCEP
mmetsp:Transcript_31882/g.77698  ORF Transcript_31882/g.77698 Transcript_31882/m.77698 type:complete len:254 (+) Transcript_31882:1345-2106(+)